MHFIVEDLNDLVVFCFDIGELEAISLMSSNEDRERLQKSYQTVLVRIAAIVDKVGEKLKRCNAPDEKSV